MNYPYIKVSYWADTFLGWNPSVEDSLVIPKEPDAPKLPYSPIFPEKPIEPILRKESILLSTIVLVLIIFFCFNFANSEASVFWGVLGWIFIGAIFYNFISNSITNEKIEKQHQSNLLEYNLKVEKWGNEYTQIDEIYQNKKLANEKEHNENMNYYKEVTLSYYQHQLEYFNKAIDSEKIRILKLNGMRNHLDLVKPKPIAKYYQDPLPMKGIAENIFYNYILEKCLSCTTSYRFNVYNDKAIVDSKFMPDLVVECFINDLTLYIDIEIDEPYVGATGQPIHFLESRDEQRDKYFTDNDWIVIRFAEEQIIKYPEACFSVIEAFIYRCRGDVVGDWPVFKENPTSKITKTLPIIKKWTFEESSIMASNQYRRTYLG